MAANDVLTVVISGAAGQIGYSLVPLVCSGNVFGANQKLVVHLFDIPPMAQKLQGLQFEIEDCGYPLVTKVVCTTDAEEAFTGVDYAALLGGFPRGPGMQRKDLMAKNAPIFDGQGKALNKGAKKTVKVVCVANPANTNCWLLSNSAPDIPKTAFSALTRLDHNRTHAQLALKLGVTCDQVTGACIWGNHSKTQFPDIHRATVTRDGKTEKVQPIVGADYEQKELIPRVQERGAEVIAARGLSSAMSAAAATADHLRSWHQGTKDGEVVSMSIFGDGSYGISKDIVYSYPVTIKNGVVSIVQGIELSDFHKERMKLTENELLAEKEEAKACTK